MGSTVSERPAAEAPQDVIEAPFEHATEQATIIDRSLQKAAQVRQKKERIEEMKRQWNVLQNAQSIGADYYEASGELPSEEVLLRLHVNGYAPAPADYLTGIFLDLDDYHSHVLTEVQERIDTAQRADAEEEADRQKMLSRIQEEAEAGILPMVLFAHFDKLKVENAPRSKKKSLLSHGVLSDDEVIDRYARYKIVSELIVERDDQKKRLDVHEHRLGVVLGIFVTTGMLDLKSFLKRVQDSNSDLVDVESIKDLPVYQYWARYLSDNEEARDRKKYLQEVLAAAKPRLKIEYFYDKDRATVVAIGEKAISGYSNDEEYRYLLKLNEQEQLDVRQKLNREKTKLFKLSTLLSERDDTKVTQDKDKYRDWEEEDFLSYGRWLLKILPEGMELTTSVVDRAHNLGIGPSRHVIENKKRFGSLGNFFLKLDVSNPVISADSLEKVAI